MSPSNSNSSFYPYLTHLRALSIFSVVFIHATSQILNHPYPVNTLTWFFVNWLDSLIRWSVPIFIMISGALLIKPNSKITPEFIRKRILRVVIPALFWLVIYFFWINRHGFIITPMHYLIQTFVYGNPYYHFYFVYAILGLYFFLPIFNAFVAQANNKPLQFAIGSSLILSGLYSFSTAFFKHQDPRFELFSFTHFLPYVGYFLLGFYLHTKNLSRLSTKLLATVFLANTTLASLANFFLVNHYGKTPTGLLLTDYASPTIVISATCIFLLLKHSSYQATHANGLLKSFANISYGLYLGHLLIMESSFQLLSTYLSQPMLLISTALITLTFSWLILYPLSKLKYANRLVGLQ